MTQYIFLTKKKKKKKIAEIYYKENYLMPNSDPGTLQTPVASSSL